MTTALCLLMYAGGAILTFYLVRPAFRQFKKRFLVNMITGFSETCNKVMRERKQQLFDDALLPLKSKQNKLEVLEVGAGPGSNFDYYPEDTAITCLEPNEFFEEKLLKNIAKYEGKITLRKYIVGKGEDMELKDIADSSMDACVCTYVLCSVDSPQQVIEQIKRVLKPGGRFLFMEHVAAAEGTWVRFFQKLINFVWHRALDCSIQRDPAVLVRNSEFSDTKIQSFDASELMKATTNVLSRMIFKLIEPHTSGFAVK